MVDASGLMGWIGVNGMGVYGMVHGAVGASGMMDGEMGRNLSPFPSGCFYLFIDGPTRPNWQK
jgi:hypothetical protein